MAKPWDDHKDEIIRLYKHENRTLKEVRALMRQRHNFRAATRTYRGKFDRWGITKYKTRRSRTLSASSETPALAAASSPLDSSDASPPPSLRRSMSSAGSALEDTTLSLLQQDRFDPDMVPRFVVPRLVLGQPVLTHKSCRPSSRLLVRPKSPSSHLSHSSNPYLVYHGESIYPDVLQVSFSEPAYAIAHVPMQSLLQHHHHHHHHYYYSQILDAIEALEPPLVQDNLLPLLPLLDFLSQLHAAAVPTRRNPLQAILDKLLAAIRQNAALDHGAWTILDQIIRTLVMAGFRAATGPLLHLVLSPHFYAVRDHACLESIIHLLLGQSDVNQTDAYGNTALHYAIMSRRRPAELHRSASENHMLDLIHILLARATPAVASSAITLFAQYWADHQHFDESMALFWSRHVSGAD